MNKCDYCGHQNASDAAQCGDCGTSLTTESLPQQATLSPTNAAKNQMLSGAAWCIGGILVTTVTYFAASGPGGGTYVVAWGAIVFGAIRFFRGLSGSEKRPTVEDFGDSALAHATRLETQGRLEEALAIYKKIAEDYPNTDSGRDARASIASLQARLG